MLPNYAQNYDKTLLRGDLIAGMVVAVMLAPQAMAYALLAGLPPQMGLYACIFPILVYALLGTSNYLAVGPVAIVALMVADTVAEHAQPGTSEYAAMAVLLSALSGIIMLIFGLLRFGRLANFLSHPVINGFINAAALIIMASQLKHLLGVDIPGGQSILATISHAIEKLIDVNLTTLCISIASLTILYLSREPLGILLRKLGTAEVIIETIAKTSALVVVFFATVLVWSMDLDLARQVRIVGDVPSGLPSLAFPDFNYELIKLLLPGAVLIAATSFLESISVARSLASKRRQSVKPDQELLALGAANLAASVSGAFPVAGGVSRSGVNYSAGANSQVSSIITALIIALTVIFLAPLFYYLPNAVLSSIVCVAILRLIDFKYIREAWLSNRADAVSSLVTFFGVLLLGVEKGILIGVGFSIVLSVLHRPQPQ